MKKTALKIVKSRKIFFNEYGQIIFVKSFSALQTQKFYQLVLKKGS
jgi:hypothetical protein